MNQTFLVKAAKSGYGNRTNNKSTPIFKKLSTKLFLLLVGINLLVVILANLFHRLGTGN